MIKQKCKKCGKSFLCKIKTTKYCSWQCRKKPSVSFYPSLNNGNIGTIQELKVCIDLLIKGYEVFKSVSYSASCDLLIRKRGRNDTLQSVEVKTKHKTISGKISFPQIENVNIIALVIGNEIFYNKIL